jgi:hypothetical protein
VYTAKDKPTNINVTIDAAKLIGSITISTKDTPKIDPGTGNPLIPYQWAVDALLETGVKNPLVSHGTATASEAAEIQYLNEWGIVAL